MYTVYVIKSLEGERYYIGYTSDLEKRLRYHNAGKNKSTKSHAPWKVVYTEDFKLKRDAWFREKHIKSYKGGEAFKNLIRRGG